MRRAAMLAVALLVLGACARSEPAGEPTDPSNLPEDVPVPVPADPVSPPGSQAEDARLAQALRAAVADGGGLSENAKWQVARTDLDGDGKDEALVYLIDPMQCGTGGCPLFLFADDGQGQWQKVTEFSVSRPPIYKLPGTLNGWADLGITTGGGGGKPALMKVARGENGYPENPTVAPATEASSEGAMLLIDEGEGTPIPAA